MFLSGTILRQIAHATPALTRPARRRDLEKIRFRLRCQWRHGRQCCPEASPGGQASCSRLPHRVGRRRRCPATTIRQAASAAVPPTGLGCVPLWCPRTGWPPAFLPRSTAMRDPQFARPAAARLPHLARAGAARPACLAATAVLVRRALARPVRGRRDGQARAQDRVRASDCAWAVLGRGSPGGPACCQPAADQTPCDRRVTTGSAFGRG
jgi:hypothetical protein